MSAKTINDFLFKVSLITIIIFSASSVLQAQSQTSSVPVEKKFKEACSTSETCADVSPTPDPHPTPEPFTVLLFGTGLFGVAAITRRHLRKNAANEKNANEKET